MVKIIILMSKQQLYLSFDVETDGPSPLINNLLSIGIAGFDENKNVVFKFESNILPLDTHTSDKECLETFWLKPEQKKAWDFLQTNQKNYINVFENLSCELYKLSVKYKLIWVAHPACFDWMFFKSYYELAKNNSSNKENFYDIGFQCKCSSTLFDYYKKKNKISSIEATKLFNEMGEVDADKNHYAIDDAIVQGKFYLKLLELLIK